MERSDMTALQETIGREANMTPPPAWGDLARRYGVARDFVSECAAAVRRMDADMVRRDAAGSGGADL